MSEPTMREVTLLKCRRVGLRTLLEDPATRKKLIEGAVDFICKVERIRP